MWVRVRVRVCEGEREKREKEITITVSLVRKFNGSRFFSSSEIFASAITLEPLHVGKIVFWLGGRRLREREREREGKCENERA